VADELLSGTVTFLFTDIEGSTQLVRRLRDGYADVLKTHERLLRGAFAEHEGQVVDTQGDAFFAVFGRAKDAVESAVAAQLALDGHDWPEGGEVRVRMGLHTGEPTLGEGRYVGLGVHRAARICSAAHGGQVLLSSATGAVVEDDLPEGWELRDLGEHRLKDLPRPEHVFQLVAPGLATRFPPLRTAEEQPFAGREGELAKEATAAMRPAWYRRRGLLAGALAGVIAAAVAIPVFAFAGGGGGSSSTQVVGNSVARIDPQGGDVVGDASLATAPRSLAYGAGAVWATNPDDGAVSRIDPATDQVVDTIPVGSGPSGIAVGLGDVWVANSLAGTVSRINPRSVNSVPSIHTGNGPAGVAYGRGSIWVTNVGDQSVVRINPRSGDVSARYSVAAGSGIAVDERGVWVVDAEAGKLTKLDPASGISQTVSVGNGPTAIALAEGSAWVANSLDGTVTRVDEDTNQVVSTIKVGDGASGIAAHDGSLWVSSEFAGTVTRIDAHSGKIVDTLHVGSRPQAVAAGSDVWVSVRSSGVEHRGGTLTVLSSTIRPTIDPALAYDPVSWSILSTTNDGLIAFRRVGGSDGGQLVPDLATSFPTVADGGKTYTFQLRRGVRYSTGALVRAGDFRRAIERGFRLHTPVDYFTGLIGASSCQKTPRSCDLSRGIVTSDAAGTVTFRLTAPDPDFTYKLATSFAYPVPAGTPDRMATQPVPATGPYRISSVRGGTLVEVRNPRFRPWAGAAQPGGYPDEIRWEMHPKGSAAVSAIVHGRADVLFDNPPPARVRELKNQYSDQLHVNPGPNTWFFFLNTRASPFTSLAVRKALNYAVDRRRAITLVGGGALARPTCQALPPNFPGYGPYCPYRYDVARARRLVRASGTSGQRVTVWTTSGDNFGLDVENRYLARVLRSLGYRAALKAVPGGVGAFFRYVSDVRNRAQTGLSGWFADYASAFGYLQPNFSCAATGVRASNTSQFCNRGVDRQIKRAAAVESSEPQAAAHLWHRIDERVTDLAPWVPLFNQTTAQLVSKRVGNYQYNPQWGVLVDQLWVR